MAAGKHARSQVIDRSAPTACTSGARAIIRVRCLRSQAIVSAGVSSHDHRRLVLPFRDPYKDAMPDPHPARPDTGVVVEEARPEVKQPPLYQVVLLNDDYTPMEFGSTCWKSSSA